MLVEGFMKPDDDMVKRELFDDQGNYNWGETDLLLRLTVEVRKFSKKGFLRPPPQELIFINRKTLGVFNFLRKLDAQINCHHKILKFIDPQSPDSADQAS